MSQGVCTECGKQHLQLAEWLEELKALRAGYLKSINKNHLTEIAKDEIAKWDRKGGIPEGLTLAILFSFVHRAVDGESIEVFMQKLRKEVYKPVTRP